MFKPIVILPTNYCNFRCEHCGVKKSEEISYISPREVERILKIAKEQGYDMAVITGGGEPSIDFEKMVKLIKIANSYGLKVRLVTNGSFLLKMNIGQTLKYLKTCGLTEFCLSYDNFHKRFISFEFIQNVLKSSIRVGFITKVMAVTTKDMKKKTFEELKKIAKNLNGKIFRTSIPFFYIDLSSYVILTKKGHFSFTIEEIQRTDTTIKRFTKDFFRKISLTEIMFHRCCGHVPVLTSDGNILPCCDFNSLNNPELYSIAHSTEITKKIKIYKHNPILKKILFDRWAFLKYYAMVRKDKKLLSEFKDFNFNRSCDFCFLLLKNKEKVSKMKEPSKFEMCLLAVMYFPYLLMALLDDLTFRINDLTFRINERYIGKLGKVLYFAYGRIQPLH
ncbi:MAG: radical SAM protein [Candidatus Altiarchaeota archaeon]